MPVWTVMLGENYCFKVSVFNAIVVGACMVISYFSLKDSPRICNIKWLDTGWDVKLLKFWVFRILDNRYHNPLSVIHTSIQYILA